MTDEEREQLRIVEALEKIVHRNRKRGYATYWYTDNKSQGSMEVDATRDWAKEMNKRGHSIPICRIKGNRDDPPDVFAEMDGEKIGVEVIELVDEAAIRKYPEIPWFEEPGPHFLDQIASLPRPPILVVWGLDNFQKRLNEIVLDKEGKAREKDKRDGKDRSLSKQFLLIVTDEPWLDEATLSGYLKTIKPQQSRNFEGIYVMGSYVPADGEGHYPVFEVTLAAGYREIAEVLSGS